MRHSRFVLFSAALSAFALPAFAADPLESCLPAGTALYFSLADSRSNAASDCAPINELRNNPKLQEFFKPFTDQIKLLSEKSKDDPLLSMDELQAHLDGQFVIGMNFAPLAASLASGVEEPGMPAFDVVFASKDGAGLIDLVVTRIKDDARMKDENARYIGSETFMGTEIHHVSVSDGKAANGDAKAPKLDENGDPITPVPSDEPVGVKASDDSAPEAAKPESIHIYFGTCRNVVFISTSKEDAQTLVEALHGHDEGTLGADSQASAVRSSAEKSDAYFYLDFRPISKLLEDLIRKNLPADAGQPDPTKPDANLIISALSLDSLHYVSMSVRFTAEEAIIDTTFSADADRGVGRLLNSYSGTFPAPDFVPEKVVSVNSSALNLGVAFKELRQIVFAAYPFSNMLYLGQVTDWQNKSGINVDKDLLDNLDFGFASYAVPTGGPASDPNSQQQLFALKVKDGASFKHALDALLGVTAMGPTVQRRDFNGTEIETIPTNSGGLSLAIKDGWILLSPGQQVIQDSLSIGAGSKSFWQSNEYSALNSRMDKGGVGASYMDVDAFIRIILVGFARGFNETATRNGKAPLDPTIIDSLDKIPLIVCGKAYRTPEGLRSEAHLMRKE